MHRFFRPPPELLGQRDRIKSASGSLCLLTSLGFVESFAIREQSPVVRVGKGEAVGGHATTSAFARSLSEKRKELLHLLLVRLAAILADLEGLREPDLFRALFPVVLAERGAESIGRC